MKYLLTAVAIIFIFTMAAAHAASYKIKEAVDINTLITTSGLTIKLLGVEPLDNDDLNQKGVQFLNGLVKSREVVVETPVVQDNSVTITTAYVWYEVFDKSHLVQEMDLPRFYYTQPRPNKYKKEGTFVFLNATIIKSGFAKASAIPADLPHSQLFQTLSDWVK